MALSQDISIEALQFYEDHPVEFCEDLIGVRLDVWQKEVLNALRDEHFIAIRSGSGVGKTVLLSLATMWFLGTKPFSKVPTTAPSQHQLHDLLWGEHHKWISRSEYLQNLLSWTQTRVGVKGYEPQWFAVARTARVSPSGKVAEGLQGFHAEENLLFILDEASGIPDEIYPAVEGALTGKKAYAILASNPTRLSGYFYSVFNDSAMRGLYKLFHISCFDSPYVEERYLKMMEAKYGDDHPIYQIKVLGDFPSSDIVILFQPEDIEKFKNNDPWDNRGKQFPIRMGLDVGRTASRSLICVSQGLKVIKFAEKYLSGGVVDTVEITNWAIEHVQAYEPESLKVDCIGIGAGVYDNLVRLYPKIVKPVIGNALPAENKRSRYVNLRAQGYWELREILPHLYCENVPDRLISEMEDLRYKIQNGKILIESKEDMIRRLGHSPDYLDSLMYSYLDEDLCSDKFNILYMPLHIGKVNSELTKQSGWDALGKNVDMQRSNRWDTLYG